MILKLIVGLNTLRFMLTFEQMILPLEHKFKLYQAADKEIRVMNQLVPDFSPKQIMNNLNLII